MSDRIDASQRTIEILRQLQEAANELQIKAQAVLFGAAAERDVPEGWQWDGSGWSAPDKKDAAEE